MYQIDGLVENGYSTKLESAEIEGLKLYRHTISFSYNNEEENILLQIYSTNSTKITNVTNLLNSIKDKTISTFVVSPNSETPVTASINFMSSDFAITWLDPYTAGKIETHFYSSYSESVVIINDIVDRIRNE